MPGNWLQSVEIGFTASDLEVRFLARHVMGPEAPGGRAGTRAEDRSGLGNLPNVRTIPSTGEWLRSEGGCMKQIVIYAVLTVVGLIPLQSVRAQSAGDTVAAITKLENDGVKADLAADTSWVATAI